MAYTISITNFSNTSTPSGGSVRAGDSYKVRWSGTLPSYVSGNWFYNSTGIAISARFQPKSGTTSSRGPSGDFTVTAQEPVNNSGVAQASLNCVYTLRSGGVGGTVWATSNEVTVYRTPSAPTSVTATNVTSTSFTVTGSGGQWGDIRVRYRWLQSYFSNGYTFTGLQPNTTYTIEAYRLNGNNGSSTITSTVTTLNETVTGSISTTASSVINGNSVTFSWSASTSDTYYYQDPGGHWNPNSGSVTGTSGTITTFANYSATYGVSYGSMRLRQDSTSGTTLDVSNSVAIYAVPAAPSITIGTITENSIQVTFTSNEVNFGTLLLRNATTSSSYYNAGSSNSETFTYSSLQPSTQYTFQAYETNGIASSTVTTVTATTAAATDTTPNYPNLQNTSVYNAPASTNYLRVWQTLGVSANTDIYWHLESNNPDAGLSTAANLNTQTNVITGTFVTNYITRQLNDFGYLKLRSLSTAGAFTSAKIYATSGNNSSASGYTVAYGYFYIWTSSDGGGTGIGDGGDAVYGLEVRNANGTTILDSDHRHGGLLADGSIYVPNNATRPVSPALISVEGMTSTNTDEIDVILRGSAGGFSNSYSVAVNRYTGGFRITNQSGTSQTFYYYAIRY